MDTINFTTLQNKIFSLLSKNAGNKFSQREIAKLLKVSPTAVGKSIKHLNNLIKIEKVKTINFISFNRDNKRAIELKRINNLKNIYTSNLSDFLEEQLAGSTIILFGSYAKGEDTTNSDIDIAVIGRKNKQININSFEKNLQRHININFYLNWTDIHKHLKNNILNGIVLKGSIEL